MYHFIYTYVVYFKKSLIPHSSNVGKSLIEGPLIGISYKKILLGFFLCTKEGCQAVVFEASDN